MRGELAGRHRGEDGFRRIVEEDITKKLFGLIRGYRANEEGKRLFYKKKKNKSKITADIYNAMLTYQKNKVTDPSNSMPNPTPLSIPAMSATIV